MRFSWKLSEKELAEYQGPVHYIAHHEIPRPDKKAFEISLAETVVVPGWHEMVC